MLAPSKKSLAKGRPSEMPQKLSHRNSMTGSESDSPLSGSPTEKLTAFKSPKIPERRSTSPRSEGKNLNGMAELESQLSQLQEDLNRTKDQLVVSKLQKRRTQKESEEAKKHLTAATDQLKDSEHQLQEISEVEGERINELLKIGHECDRAWQSELEAARKQQSAALVSAVNELHRVRIHCEMLISSEAAHAEQAEKATSELQYLKREMAGKACLIKELRNRIAKLERSEAGYQELINVSHLQLEMAKDTIATLQSKCVKLTETLNSTCSELEESKAQVSELRETMRKVKAEGMVNNARNSAPENAQIQLRSELDYLRLEVEQLKSALEVAAISYQEEQIRSILHVQSAFEAAEAIKIDSSLQEAKLELLLKEAKSKIDELKLNLIDKENVLQGLFDLNERLNAEKESRRVSDARPEFDSKLKELMENVAELKACLMDKENVIQCILEENSVLRSEIEKQAERHNSYELVKSEIGVAQAAEQEALAKLEMVTQLASRNGKEVVMLAEQLRYTRVANLETESEMQRLKVQMQQWRKAAGMAMAILPSEDYGKMAKRTGALDSDYVCNGKRMTNSTSLDDNDESESMKKKNNMLKRFSIMLLKKGQK